MKGLEEIFFGFLGVDTAVCRKRFVCEMEFRTRQNPFVQFIFGRIGNDLFRDYRIMSEREEIRPKKYTDCGRLYNECKTPYEQSVGVEAKDKPKNRRKFRTTSAAPTSETAEFMTESNVV